MQTVTRYKADDGSEHATPEAASQRDADVAFVRDATAPLGPAKDLRSGAEYQQHRVSDVTAVKVRLLRRAAERDPLFAQWIARGKANGVSEADVHPRSWAGRYFDDTGGPLAVAWGRLSCIDAQGREWQQPYYVEHPNPAAKAV